MSQRAINATRDRAKLAKQLAATPGITPPNAWVAHRWPVLGGGLALGIAAYGFLHQAFGEVDAASDQQQERWNLETSTQWKAYMPHREIITGILESAQLTTQGRLCVLGAGNSNDLDLRRLLRTYSTIDLLDIDSKALARGLLNQFPESDELASRVALHSGMDALGVPLGADPDTLIESLRNGGVSARFRKAVPHGCDVVAGTCIASQLADTLLDRLNLRNHRDEGLLHRAMPALVQQYIGILVAMARPRDSSVVVHVSDIFASSELQGELLQRGRARPSVTEEEVMKRAHVGDIFPGTNVAHYMAPGLHRFLTSGEQIRKDGKPYYWSWCLDNSTHVRCFVSYGIHWRYTKVPEKRVCPDGASYTWSKFDDRFAKEVPLAPERMERFYLGCQPVSPLRRIEL